MLSINTIDNYIECLRGYNHRVAPLIAEIAQAEPADQELMRLSQSVEKRQKEASALITRLRKAKTQIQNRNPQAAANMDWRIEEARKAYNAQSGASSTASFKRGFLIFRSILCVCLSIFGILAIISGQGTSDACGNYCCGGLCLLGGLGWFFPLIGRISEAKKTVSNEQMRAGQLEQDYESLRMQKDEMLRRDGELEQELAALEQDYNNFLARGLKDGAV